VESLSKLPKSLLRFSTAGSVDDGKSTFIGRLLFDTGNIYDDHVQALKLDAERRGEKKLALALVTDGLRAEREQGITIDVAYRYFSTRKRRFILADSPGHEQYTRNMATAASSADLTVVLMDAKQGILPQTKRHAFVAALLGVPRLLIAVNKMDLVSYSEERFQELVDSFSLFINKLGVKEVKFIPVVAIDGDNIARRSTQMPWYTGETVLEYLEEVFIGADTNQADLRLPIQYVIRHGERHRGYAGSVGSGSLRVGDEVIALPSERKATVTSILLRGGEQVAECKAGDAVSISLSQDIDVARGSMLAHPHNPPRVTTEFSAMIIWCAEEPFSGDSRLIIRHTTQEARAKLTSIDYIVDIHDLREKQKTGIELNDIARVSIRAQTPLFIDSYQRNRSTGNFIIIDLLSNKTVAAGMLLDVENQRLSSKSLYKEQKLSDLHPPEKRSSATSLRSLGTQPITLWLTGLSGAGKTTIARAYESQALKSGQSVIWLDGDTLRSGLSADLGFSRRDRTEHVRRTAELAKLLNDSGFLVICSLISPLIEQRAMAKEIIGDGSFFEIYVKASLETCESRDPHGLYARARNGDLAQFTGIDSTYEAPQTPDLILDTELSEIDDCVAALKSKINDL
jgi:bifunctional enzyme CysN/CysC